MWGRNLTLHCSVLVNVNTRHIVNKAQLCPQQTFKLKRHNLYWLVIALLAAILFNTIDHSLSPQNYLIGIRRNSSCKHTWTREQYQKIGQRIITLL